MACFIGEWGTMLVPATNFAILILCQIKTSLLVAPLIKQFSRQALISVSHKINFQ